MSEEHLKLTLKALKDRFGLQDSQIMKYPPALVAEPGQVVQICQALRGEFGFDFLCELTAVDYWPEQEPRFNIVYGFYSHANNVRMALRVPLNGDNPTLHTVEEVYRGANWHERELWDMFGINFEGHSDLRRILMPHDWEGHPLRKDYPLGYEEPQFTFNYDEIDKRKHHARYEEA
ncbi:MAG: NADH-quinone oxidoreductase subunit C [Chloroflexi bacterium RBG_13_50_21]|nr:MAG: NADH-quinone oxidoreductase subunit C [Chloroflexi bacterium RBG_13_50_21]